MAQTIKAQYYIGNVDCAACAAKIENTLRKLEGVDNAVLDFASLTLHIESSPTVQLIEEIRKVEPTATLTPKSEAVTAPAVLPGAGKLPTRDIFLLGLAIVLFIWQLVAKSYNTGFSSAIVITIVVFTAYLAAGWNVLINAWSTIRRRVFFDENVLMVIATMGALAIGAHSEAIGVMIFYKIGELLQERTVSRSRRSIRALLAVRPDTALVKSELGYTIVPPEQVQIGQEILVKPGEKVPLDGIVLAGESQLDSSILTGESKPVAAEPGGLVMAGQVNISGALIVRVSKRYTDSSIAKVMDMVETATARKAQTEKFITTFSRYYTPAVVVVAAAVAFLPPLISAQASFETWIYRALVLLVISCPCALVVSIPLGYFGGIGHASRSGVLVKGSNYMDILASVDTLVFDKTGTLTKGVFTVKEVVCSNGFSKNRLLEYAAAAEAHSNHPIAAAIEETYMASGGKIDVSKITGHVERPGKGVMIRYEGHSILVGSDQLLHEESIDHPSCEFDSTVVNVVVDGYYAGYLSIGDEVRPDAKRALKMLKKSGIHQIVMLTGDNACAAEAVAASLGIDSYFADLLPEDKVKRLEEVMAQKTSGGKTAFIGDGINDSPAIARADVGIAMGALGSDAAIETADVVLMTDSPLKLVRAIAIARRTRAVIWQNIALAFIIKGIFIGFGAFGLATMWEAVFADMGTALLAVLNATRTLGNDRQTTV